jgi:hypothetical protein
MGDKNKSQFPCSTKSIESREKRKSNVRWNKKKTAKFPQKNHKKHGIVTRGSPARKSRGCYD